jgi:hypothetical protein
MRKYDLAKMLEEIRRDEGDNGNGNGSGPAKKILTQRQIKELARAKRAAAAGKPAAK